MALFKFRNKKIIAGVLLTTALSGMLIEQVKAQTTTDATTAALNNMSSAMNGMSTSIQNQGSVLQQIATYTNGILVAVTSLTNPVVVSILSALTNITTADSASTSPTPTLVSGFTTYANDVSTSLTKQLSLQSTLLMPVFGNFTTTTVPNANDLQFTSIYSGTSLAQTPFYATDPRPVPTTGPINSGLNYIQLIAGLGVQHMIPNYPSKWTGSASSIITYTNYFNTVTALQSFNAYILSQLYEDAQQGIPAAQTALITQATDTTNWFPIIASESIGAVLRQILMYQSQSYVIQTQILQTQKMLLAAQSVNTTMQMLQSQLGEGMLVSKAISAPLR